MSEPFIAEIRIFAGNFAPRSWAFCDGQLLPISQNTALFSLIGTTYGGDGRTTFALPDLRSRAPIHKGNGGGSTYSLGQKGGEETHTLAAGEMPSHTHVIQGSADTATQSDPTGNVLAQSTQLYRQSTNLVDMISGTMTNQGGGQAHDNMQPYLAVNFCIALQGLFPSRN